MTKMVTSVELCVTGSADFFCLYLSRPYAFPEIVLLKSQFTSGELMLLTKSQNTVICC